MHEAGEALRAGNWCGDATWEENAIKRPLVLTTLVDFAEIEQTWFPLFCREGGGGGGVSNGGCWVKGNAIPGKCGSLEIKWSRQDDVSSNFNAVPV